MSKIIMEFTHEEIDQAITDLQRLATVQTMAQIEERVAIQFSDKITELTQKVEELNNPKPKAKGKRWSRKYDACIKCGQSDAPHASKGLCTRCYQKKLHGEKSKTIIPLHVRSEGVDTRPQKERV